MSELCIQISEYTDNFSNLPELMFDEYEFSPLAIAIESNSIDDVKSITVTKDKNEYQVTMQTRFTNDRRWHTIEDTIFCESTTKQFITSIIEQLKADDKKRISESTALNWKQELNRLKFNGITLNK